MNIAYGRPVTASSTCGEVNGQPIREKYCNIAGSSDYVPDDSQPIMEDPSMIREARAKKQTFVQGGQNCGFCEANSTKYAHPAENMVDGTAAWWQSPPISRGTQYNFINITIDLEQEFHVSSVWIQMANSPRPAAMVFERSTDYGKTYVPWQYFAENPAECYRRFNLQEGKNIETDDEVICSQDFTRIQPLVNGEIFFTVLAYRPSENNFSHSPVLQNFARATNVRLRLLQTNTLKGQYMDVTDRNDPTLTGRYFYAIKEIYLTGRCVCNGHAASCDIAGPHDPRRYLCRCEHNTCGAQCDQCCPGFEQKKWRRSKDKDPFECEPCNCHGHSHECVYEEELEEKGQSLDIHGRFDGGGRCLNCQHNTNGINCNKCADKFFRPVGKFWNETDVCHQAKLVAEIIRNKNDEFHPIFLRFPLKSGRNSDRFACSVRIPNESSRHTGTRSFQTFLTRIWVVSLTVSPTGVQTQIWPCSCRCRRLSLNRSVQTRVAIAVAHEFERGMKSRTPAAAI
ncbi:hypothetical protein L596_004022 [Steinernema carpocapsae]|uniref:Laminin N-terminal domain-containing protein n=1 Tax=Steinernema carpocapsae TaxID=34508 RepID=A0A4U8UXW4_STECR|nr:hypothetical protein L596_004022 [Steinernema carpocapsae]